MTDVNVDKVLKVFVVIIVFAEPKLSDSHIFLLAKVEPEVHTVIQWWLKIERQRINCR